MPIITLTTDLGLRDFYVAVLKGELMKVIPNVSIVDISHDIDPFAYAQAAFILSSSFRHFPDSTIHIVGVDTSRFKGMKHLIIQSEGHTFIGPDNGLFALVFEEKLPEKIFAMNESANSGTLPVADIYVRIAKEISEGKTLESLGEKINSISPSGAFRPIINANNIKATVLYIDRFENVILNVKKTEFEAAGKGRKFYITFRRNDEIERIEENYNSIQDGNISCIVNSAGYIELFMKHGNMAGLCGLKNGDGVQIEFR